jgi:hypothetical protein
LKILQQELMIRNIIDSVAQIANSPAPLPEKPIAIAAVQKPVTQKIQQPKTHG